MDAFAQQLVNGLTLGSLYALIAVGYTVVYGIVQLINFAHGEIFMIGAFGALSTWLIFFEGNTALWVLPFMIIGAILASVTTAVLMERIAYRPLRNAPKLAPLVSAIGVSFIFQNIGLFWGGLPMEVFGGGAAAAAPKAFPSLIPNYNLLGEASAIRVTPKDLVVIGSSLGELPGGGARPALHFETSSGPPGSRDTVSRLAR